MCLVEYLVIPIICDRIFNTQFFYFFSMCLFPLMLCAVDSCVYEINFYKCTRASSTCVCLFRFLSFLLLWRKKKWKEETLKMFVTGNIKYSYQIRNWKRHKNIRNILFLRARELCLPMKKEKPYKVAILLCVLFFLSTCSSSSCSIAFLYFTFSCQCC